MAKKVSPAQKAARAKFASMVKSKSKTKAKTKTKAKKSKSKQVKYNAKLKTNPKPIRQWRRKETTRIYSGGQKPS